MRISLGELRETMKVISQYNRYSGRKSKGISPEYEEQPFP
jgi:hypothetical protein